MDKKDIYEHLANIYLDASSKRKRKNKKYSPLFRNLFIASAVIIAGLSSVMMHSALRHKSSNSEIALLLNPDAVKINFNFDPAKKEMYTLDLNHLNMIHFKALVFSVKKANYGDVIKMRVEFTNRFRERSEMYLAEIPHKWQEQSIALKDFKHISDWGEMTSVSFGVEEWNTKEKSGIVYIDNIRLLK